VTQQCFHCAIERLTIRRLYVHSSSADSSVDATQANAIRFSGSWLVIADNTIHDVGWALYPEWNNGDGQNRIYGNDIRNVDHGFASTSAFAGGEIGPVYFYRNHVHDFANWDTSTDVTDNDYLSDSAGGGGIYNNTIIGQNKGVSLGGCAGLRSTTAQGIRSFPERRRVHGQFVDQRRSNR